MTDAFKRPSLREAARRGVQANRQDKATQQPQQPTAPAPAAPAPATPAESQTEQVAARCGHAVAFELYPDGRDQWRESRRKQITDRDRPARRKKAHAERQAAEMEAARQRRGGKPKREGKPVHQPPARLPHGATFHIVYDAQAQQWPGLLTVPGASAEPAVFTASAGGVFRLLQTLDGMYRESLTAEGGASGQ